MRIVNLDTFLTLPAGTMFYKYKPCVVTSGLTIKGETLPDIRDFLISEISFFVEPAVMTDDAIEKEGQSFPAWFDDGYQRDACFKEDQLFMIFEEADLHALLCTVLDSKIVAKKHRNVLIQP
jgi:hypothetical protein